MDAEPNLLKKLADYLFKRTGHGWTYGYVDAYGFKRDNALSFGVCLEKKANP